MTVPAAGQPGLQPVPAVGLQPGRQPAPGDGHLAPGVDALLRSACDEVRRLLGADGAFAYLYDPAVDRLRFRYHAGIAELPADHFMRSLELPAGVGLFGRAVATRRVVVTGDYLRDGTFIHNAESDRFAKEVGLRSLVAAPMIAGDEVFGALGTFSADEDFFNAPQIGLVRALADHAALAMANARLIEELDRSREALARTALVERSLRELGTRISGARDPEAVVQHTIDEARRLLHGEGARIDLVDPEVNLLRGAYSSGEEEILETEWPRDPNDTLEVGASGRAVTTGLTYISPDYLSDPQLVHGFGPDTYASSKGIRGVIASPLLGETGPFGAITVWSTEPDAFDAADAALLETIAGQAAVALGRARLIEELGRSRETLARRADEEQALREIAGRLGRLGEDPAATLDRIVHEAARLLGAERARLDLVEPVSGSHLLGFPADTPFPDALRLDMPDGQPPVGLAGLAIREGRAVVARDYLADTRFTHYEEGDAGVRDVGLRAVVAAPVVGEDGLLGVLQAGHRDVDAFGADALRLIDALAGQVSIAVANARLADRLTASQTALERTADAERALREIARRMMTLQDPATLLQDVVEEARRVLGSDGAHLTRMSEDRAALRPAVIAGRLDDATRRWLGSQSFALDGGLNGLAASTGHVTWTPDYAADPRIPHGADDVEVARIMGLGAMAAAPLREPGGEVIGTLAVSYQRPQPIAEDRLATLQALADHAAIAISNSDLLARLEASEQRYRFLVENSPDIIYATDADGRVTYFSESVEQALGRSASELVGLHFREIVRTPDGVPAGRRFAEMVVGRNSLTSRMDLLGASGEYIPFEVTASAMRMDGVFAGVHGAARDIRDRERLERELRESEERYRFLVQSSPDLIWMTDADGRFTFVSDQATRILGWPATELVGRRFEDLAPPLALRGTIARFRMLQRRPAETHRTRFRVLRRDGRERSMEVTAIGMVAGGRFIGAHGVARDVSDLERLEMDLRRQAAEIAASEERAHLARELHDSVTQALFSMTLVSRSIEILLDRDPAQVPQRLASLRELQRDALAEMRALIFELRPGNIEEYGLIQALRTHGASLSGRIGLPVVVEADADLAVDRPPIELEEALYRIAQEALHNVVKHAGAREVRIGIGRVPDGVRMVVTDDGRGFDPAAVPDGHLGIAGMRARTERLAGTMDVRTGPGQGTTIEVVLPETTGAPTATEVASALDESGTPDESGTAATG